MKHYLLATLLTFLALPSFAQLNCDYIDPVCQKARELMEQGQYEQALKGLEKAKSDPGIRNCSDAYKIDDLIRQLHPSTFYAKGYGRYSWASDEYINTPSELGGFSINHLNLMLAEIYARHGFIFDDAELKTYFNQQAWYRPVSYIVVLSSLEEHNVKMILEAAKMRDSQH